MRGLVLCLCLCSLGAFAGPPEEHPIVGVWEFTLPDGRCTETYLFRADGTSLVTSAQEVAETAYKIEREPGASGFYKMVDTVTRDNGKQDCSGSVTEVGHTSTNYLRFHPSGDLLLMCRAESFDACFGPLRRLPVQDS
jgi:hypothetical protein